MSDLSENQIELVRSTWEQAKDDMTQVGVQVFMQFFSKHPEHRDSFPKISHLVSEEAGVEDPDAMQQLETFATAGMGRWDEVLGVLDDAEKLDEVLQERAKFYNELKVPSTAFSDFNQMLLEVLTGKYELNEEAQEAWQKVLAATAEILISHMEA